MTLLRAAQCRDTDGWDWTSRKREFDLSLCAEEGVILTTILVVFVLAAFLRIVFPPYPSRRVISRGRWHLFAKLTLLALALLTSLTTLTFVIPGRIPTATDFPYLLEPLALFLAVILTRSNHICARSSSTILLLFWPSYTIALLIWTRSYVHTFSITPLVPFKGTVLSFGLLSFALECFSPGNSESPKTTANVFSIWVFGWLTPLLHKGSRTTITQDDLPAFVPREESAKLGNDLHRAFEKHAGLWSALFAAYGGPIVIAVFLKLTQDSLAFVQPALLKALLSYISKYQESKSTDAVAGTAPLYGYAIAFTMFAVSVVQTVLLHQYFQMCHETGLRFSAGLITLIYKKALVLSGDERWRATGDIVNLMSVDVGRIQDLCGYGLVAISGPYQVILAFISLYRLLGWSAFVGMAILILSIPLNAYIARILKTMHQTQMKNRDQRARLMSELLANIKSIKLYAWDYTFIRRILHVRNDQELKMLGNIGIATVMNMTLWSGIPSVVTFGSFATASVFSATPLTAGIIFPSISLFMLLQSPLGMFSQVTTIIVEAIVSAKRISEFLHAEELQDDVVTRIEKRALDMGDAVLSIRDGAFQWTKNSIRPTLEDINVQVRKGELIGILGGVGSGKSSLLSAIIGDMQKTRGRISLSGSVAYAAQDPWILSATIRDNILFSHTYDETFYDLVIEACALKADLAVLPQGDLTEVGERGVTLSGGQCARIALARAVYARADLVLLDDVLAAVDFHVARHIFDHVLGSQGLLATKARILVTNNVGFLKHFDALIYIQRGVILERGSYRQLMLNPDSAVYNLIRNHDTNGPSSGATSGTSTPRPCGSDSDSEVTLIDEVDSIAAKGTRPESLARAVLAPLPDACTPTGSGLSKERNERGHVKKEVYLHYLHAASEARFLLFVSAMVMSQVTSVMSTYMLRLWGEDNRRSGVNAGVRDPNLLGYGVFKLVSILMSMAGLLLWVLSALRGSKNLHDKTLESMMRAPLSFFEMTPNGRILNLFSHDIYAVDAVLGKAIQSLVRTATSAVSIILLVGFSFPPFFIAIVPVSWFYYQVTIYYLSTSRELKRLIAISKSPIFAWFSETLSGASTIRAYGQEAIFVAQNALRIDRNQMCYFASFSANRWLAIRQEFVAAVIILFTATFAISAVTTRDVDPGLVGMVLSYAFRATGALNYFVRSASEVERNVVSVERITHYANNLPVEAPHELPSSKPPANWPSAGQVEFRNFSLRYRPELDLALKDISLTIKPKEKIGIVGRTGSGKSSLLLALFRILEAASGKIVIDGVDISTIGLHDLRSAITIVPQSPDMFEGTLRENIDPAGEYPTADIWVALEQVCLKSYVDGLPDGLDARVSEGGASLSAGQRQLFCFARALLKKSKVLVLDEATSAVDLDTDRAVQEIIRGPMFEDVTILTIAHRLSAITGSTRVVVLEQGRVAEFDTPDVLLADRSSRFHAIALEAGLAEE